MIRRVREATLIAASILMLGLVIAWFAVSLGRERERNRVMHQRSIEDRADLRREVKGMVESMDRLRHDR